MNVSKAAAPQTLQGGAVRPYAHAAWTAFDQSARWYVSLGAWVCACVCMISGCSWADFSTQIVGLRAVAVREERKVGTRARSLARALAHTPARSHPLSRSCTHIRARGCAHTQSCCRLFDTSKVESHGQITSRMRVRTQALNAHERTREHSSARQHTLSCALTHPPTASAQFLFRRCCTFSGCF